MTRGAPPLSPDRIDGRPLVAVLLAAGLGAGALPFTAFLN